MNRTELQREIKMKKFEEALAGWNGGRLSQAEAALLLGVCERSFRRYVSRYEAQGLAGLQDRRLDRAYHRAVPVDEALALVEGYRREYAGWNVRHYHSHYRREGGTRSYSWVKKTLQAAQCVGKAKARGVHRKKRDPMPLPGMMLHQDGSRHEWVSGCWWDLIVTMDDATNAHYSMFFVEEEGTASSLQGVREVIERHGLFGSLYTDRGSHYWHTPEAGGKVDTRHLTQFGQALQRVGIQRIAAYSPQARGRSERMFGTHQGRLPQELARAGVRTLDEANRYLREVYLPAFNAEFARPAREQGSAFVPWIGGNLEDWLCEQHERVVGADNCVRFDNHVLQIPADRHRCHYVKAKVRVHRYLDGGMAIFHGPRKLASYDAQGRMKPMPQECPAKRRAA